MTFHKNLDCNFCFGETCLALIVNFALDRELNNYAESINSLIHKMTEQVDRREQSQPPQVASVSEALKC